MKEEDLINELINSYGEGLEDLAAHFMYGLAISFASRCSSSKSAIDLIIKNRIEMNKKGHNE